MNKKLFTKSLLLSITYSSLVALFVFGFLKVFFSLTNDNTIGYFAAIASPLVIIIVIGVSLIKNILIVKNQLKIRKDKIIDREVMKRAAELVSKNEE
jgi:cytosine/uracil/thiamine/allantoin permease